VRLATECVPCCCALTPAWMLTAVMEYSIGALFAGSRLTLPAGAARARHFASLNSMSVVILLPIDSTTQSLSCKLQDGHRYCCYCPIPSAEVASNASKASGHSGPGKAATSIQNCTFGIPHITASPPQWDNSCMQQSHNAGYCKNTAPQPQRWTRENALANGLSKLRLPM